MARLLSSIDPPRIQDFAVSRTSLRTITLAIKTQ